MVNIEWKEEYNIGIPEIDNQHKRLIDIINSIANNKDPENIFDNVMKMSKYADDHFDLEERLLFRCGCKTLQEHRHQHLLFRQKTSELAGLDYTSGEYSRDALLYLSKWLIEHILTMDKAYKKYFQVGIQLEDL